MIIQLDISGMEECLNIASSIEMLSNLGEKVEPITRAFILQQQYTGMYNFFSLHRNVLIHVKACAIEW